MFIYEFWSIFDFDKRATSNFDSKSKSKYSTFYLEEDLWLFLSFVDHYDPPTTTSSNECGGQNRGQKWLTILYPME